MPTNNRKKKLDKTDKRICCYSEETGELQGFYHPQRKNIPVPNFECTTFDVDYVNDSQATHVNIISETERTFYNIPPTQEEILKNNLSARIGAYRKEADPLFFEWQYDKTPESKALWRAKVEEIKQRFPIN